MGTEFVNGRNHVMELQIMEGQTDVEVQIGSCLDVGAKGKHIRPEEGAFSVTFI